MQIIIGQVFIHTLNDAATSHQRFKFFCDRTACIVDKGTDDGIVASVFPVADRLCFRIALQFQHIIHYVPWAVNIKIAEMIAIIPFLNVFGLLCQVSIL